MDTAPWSATRQYQMPVLHLSIQQVVEAVAQRYGRSAKDLVRYAPDPSVERLFASAPPLLTPKAERLGLKSDGTIGTLVERALGQFN